MSSNTSNYSFKCSCVLQLRLQRPVLSVQPPVLSVQPYGQLAICSNYPCALQSHQLDTGTHDTCSTKCLDTSSCNLAYSSPGGDPKCSDNAGPVVPAFLKTRPLSLFSTAKPFYRSLVYKMKNTCDWSPCNHIMH
jgi:hypothetical protein